MANTPKTLLPTLRAILAKWLKRIHRRFARKNRANVRSGSTNASNSAHISGIGHTPSNPRLIEQLDVELLTATLPNEHCLTLSPELLRRLSERQGVRQGVRNAQAIRTDANPEDSRRRSEDESVPNEPEEVDTSSGQSACSAEERQRPNLEYVFFPNRRPKVSNNEDPVVGEA